MLSLMVRHLPYLSVQHDFDIPGRYQLAPRINNWGEHISPARGPQDELVAPDNAALSVASEVSSFGAIVRDLPRAAQSSYNITVIFS